jgi:D-hexose-6-phosphate mutarotase
VSEAPRLDLAGPWMRKAHSLPDFADDEWTQMIRIETSNVSDFAVDFSPGQQHKMKALVKVDQY